MALKIRKISEIVGMQVFTDAGEEFGEVEEATLHDNKVDMWRIRISRSSNLSNFLGSAKGVVVPHNFVKAIGDVVIISKSAVPIREDVVEEETTEE
ncbi:MAG: PRC-barrel domain-containing protein [Nanoarchaeota archaeon]